MESVLDYPVVGVTFEGRQDVLKRFYDKYAYGRRYGVRLIREDDNKYDANAVGVELETSPGAYEKIGYISRDSNADMRSRWGRLKNASLRSIGYNSNGQLGLAITVTYNDEEE